MIWRVLTEPHLSVQTDEQRRQARLLAGLSLALLVGTAALVIWSLGLDPSAAAPGLPLVGLLLVSYLLSRTSWPEWSARLLTFGITLAHFAVLASVPDPAVAAARVPFVMLTVLIAAVLLPATLTAVVAALNVLGLILLLLTPWLELSHIATPFVLVVLVSIFTTTTAFLREHDLKVIRQQTGEMRQYSRTLQQDTEQRVRDLLAAVEVGRAATGMRDLNQLLKQVVALIAEHFDAHRVQVYLLDESGGYVTLREAIDQAGQQVLADHHRLAIGSSSAVGQAITNRHPVMVTEEDSDAMQHPNLPPPMRSELALPLVTGGQVIGALDLYSNYPNAFRDADLRIFQTMADHLAVAIENARLFERAQQDLREIEALSRRLTSEGWERFQAGRPDSAPVGYQSSPEGIQPILPGEVTGRAEPKPGTLSVPLVVRGEPIGVLDVTPRSGEAPDEDLQSIIQAVAERVAQALDTTRLGEQALRQAEREQVLSRLSAELQATTDLDVILRVAAREASRALGAPRGFVHLIMEYGPAHKTTTDE